MKYYKLELNSNKEIIGSYPQNIGSKNVADINKIYNYGWEGPIKSLPVLPLPILNPKANLTTFINIHINKLIFLVVEKSFIEFLDNFHVGHFQTWNIEVDYKDKILNDYRLFHLSHPSQKKLVDFKRSKFLVGQLGDWKDPSIRKLVEIENYKGYSNLQEVLRNSKDNLQLRCNKLVLDLTGQQSDLFRLSNIPYFGNGYYASERLRQSVEQKGFIGMVFKEIEQHNKRIKIVY